MRRSEPNKLSLSPNSRNASMHTVNPPEIIDATRRRFVGTAAAAAAVAQFGAVAPAQAETGTRLPAITPGAHTSLGPLKQIDAGDLSIGYADVGPANGPVVILLHGWPYDIHSFADVAPALASAGYRAIVPYVRGYGTTRFLSGGTFRNGQPSAVAADTVAMMDALK